jgi:RNA polymerase sigma factor (sigma-70 family)
MTAPARETVYIVDDDASVRKSLDRLMRSAGFGAKIFSSAGEFLKSPLPTGPSCLVLDIRMPGMDGLELQETINSVEARSIPVIFITGHGNVPMGVKAMKAGAVDFLTKPFNDYELLNAIRIAFQKDEKSREKKARTSDIKERIDTLTPREREVMLWVVTGMLNKQVAGKLGITEKTVKAHRGRVMQKMKVQSFAELVRIAQESGIKSPISTI